MADARDLSRRERQIMDVIWESGRATAQEIRDRIPEPPSYSAVRALLRILENKGHVRHHQDGPRYVYEATIPRTRARRRALEHLVRTFFDGSTAGAVAALLDLKSSELTDEEFERLARIVDEAREDGR
jgi:predicted transcriptional regulator